MAFLTHPFTIGLGIGLILAAIIWIKGLLGRRRFLHDNNALREHLHTHMEITAKGTQSTQSELDQLRQQNENFRITIASLKRKPGREELRTLMIYDKAIRLMNAQAPGFAPAWEKTLEQAEQEIAKMDKGFVPFIRRVFRPALPSALQDTPLFPSYDASVSKATGSPVQNTSTPHESPGS